jgi:o-succinylbenzoate---CoA ligase
MLYISKEGDVINTEPSNEYFKRVFVLIEFWNSDIETISIKTSGSTGTAKTIVVSREKILSSIDMTQTAFYLNNNDSFFCCLNINYIAGMMMVFRALKIGGDLIVVEPSSNPFEKLNNLDYLLRDNRGRNFFAFVPLQLQTILSNEKWIELANTAKAIIIGGAAIDKETEKKCKVLRSSVYATYGMTETLSHVAIRNINEKETSYLPLKGVEIAKNDNNCLLIKAAVTDNKWLTTNDIVEIKSKNRFIIKGRIDNVINTGGVKVNLEEIEIKIQDKLKMKSRFFCFGLEDKVLGQKLVLVIESTEIPIDRQKLIEIFSKFEVPKEIFFIQKFKETGSGKIDKIKTLNEIVQHKIPNV